MDETVRAIIEHGALYSIVIGVGYAIYRIVMYAAGRLFDENDGILTLFFERFIAFMDSQEDRDHNREEFCEKHTELLQVLTQEVRIQREATGCVSGCLREFMARAEDFEAPFSTAHFNETMIDLAEADLINLRDPKDEAELQKAERYLQRIIERHRNMLATLKHHGRMPKTGNNSCDA